MATKTRAFDFVVKGVRPFPIDMLRYDRCLPVDPESVDAIEASIRREMSYRNGPGSPSPFTVKLRAYASSGFREPTEGRWDSMGWSVVPGSLQKVT